MIWMKPKLKIRNIWKCRIIESRAKNTKPTKRNQ